MLEPSAAGGPTRAFSPVWFGRLYALARIFSGRLAHVLARIYWFALPCRSLGDHCLFSHATADQPSADAAEKRLTVERVVLNALAEKCGFAAGYLRLRRLVCHRLRRSRFTPLLNSKSLRSTRGSVCESECAD